MQPQARPYIVPPCHEQIEILYQDEHLLLVSKPPWLLTVPGRLPENADCVISRLQRDFRRGC
jgi:tRNA pseudouridine32 synthase / 23S rRNA pseudouridine746 synthase